MTFYKNYEFLLSLVIVAVAGLRLIPHPDNFTPLLAISFLGASYFQKKWQSLIIPLLVLFLSDLIIGFYSYMWSVYFSLALIALVGSYINKNISPLARLSYLIGASLFFYFLTNTAYFFTGISYPLTLSGYVTCLVAAIPFFKNALAGDIVYGVLFVLSAEFLRSKSTFNSCRSFSK